MKLECDWPRAIPSGLTQEPYRCKTHKYTQLKVIYIQNNIKNRTKYKIKSTNSKRSHANKNKHKNDKWFKEHFGQNLSPQNTRNGVSEHQDFKHFWGSMPLDPPSGWPLQGWPDSLVIKKKHDFIYLKSWTIFLC